MGVDELLKSKRADILRVAAQRRAEKVDQAILARAFRGEL